MVTVPVVAPLVMVVVVPSWPDVTTTVMSAPSMKAFPLRVWHTIVPIKDSASLAIGRPPKPPRFLQEGKVFHYLQMIAQSVDLTTFEVSWLIVVRMPPIWLSDRERDLHGDVARVTAPSPEVKRPSVLAPPGGFLQIVHHTAAADSLGGHLLCPVVNRDALDVNLDAELPADIVGVATLALDRELVPTAVVGEDAHVHHVLPVSWFVEDDQELLGEVLKDLDVVVVDVELVA